MNKINEFSRAAASTKYDDVADRDGQYIESQDVRQKRYLKGMYGSEAYERYQNKEETPIEQEVKKLKDKNTK